MNATDTTAAALAQARFDRGQTVTADEARALNQWTMFGSDSYPVNKLGRKWTINHPLMPSALVYSTKGEAVAMWEMQIHILIRLKGLQQYAALTQGSK